MQMLFAKTFLFLEGAIICVLMNRKKMTEGRVVRSRAPNDNIVQNHINVF